MRYFAHKHRDRRTYRPLGKQPSANVTKQQDWTGCESKGQKVKGQVLDTALLHDEHMLRSAFTISKVAADWHELMIPQLANNWTRDAACRHTIAPINYSLGLHPVARKLLLISRPAKGECIIVCVCES